MEDVFGSVFGSIHAFVYRCRNDDESTMEYLSDGVERITGYRSADILHSAGVVYAKLMPEIDHDRIIAEVDAAIEAGESWDITHRLVHIDGHHVWVRERGMAVYENGEVAHLQGLVVGAEAEVALRKEMEQRVIETQNASAGIAKLTRQITRSVRELSMLSTNARIEAARSGDAGKGFAVVANEMKLLADHNAVWADEITNRVQQFGN